MARWVRATSGHAWDRDPAWTRDGRAIVFSSDRGGNFDLWRATVHADGSVGEPERLTSTPESESAPTVAPDGTIAFVRGYGRSARVWLRAADGTEHRLTKESRVELAPVFSADGGRIAYVQPSERGTRLLVRGLQCDARLGGEYGALHPTIVAWSPTGDRIALTESAGRGGAFVAADRRRLGEPGVDTPWRRGLVARRAHDRHCRVR